MTTMIAVASFAAGFFVGMLAFFAILWLAKNYPNEES